MGTAPCPDPSPMGGDIPFKHPTAPGASNLVPFALGPYTKSYRRLGRQILNLPRASNGLDIRHWLILCSISRWRHVLNRT